MLRYLLFISLSLMSLLPAEAQSLLPDTTQHYSLQATLPSDTIQVYCIMKRQGNTILGSFFKELGPSMTDFSYDLPTQKLKLLHCVTPGSKGLRRRYIKHGLRIYTRQLLQAMEQGRNSISDEKHHFTLTITPTQDEF